MLALLLTAPAAWSAEVIQARDQRVLINRLGMEMQVGSRLLLRDENNRAIGIIEVTQVRGGRAIGKILRGRAEIGNTVHERRTATAPQPPPPPSEETADTTEDPTGETTSEETSEPGRAWGALFGYMNQTMTVAARSTGAQETILLKGTNFAIKGFIDFDYGDTATIRGVVGLHPFVVRGSPSSGNQVLCNNTNECSINFNYLAFEGHFRYNLSKDPHRYWISAGLAAFTATGVSSSVTSLDTSVRTNWMLSFQGGADWKIGHNQFIPTFLEYGFFPPGGGVSASSISLYLGYGIRF